MYEYSGREAVPPSSSTYTSKRIEEKEYAQSAKDERKELSLFTRIPQKNARNSPLCLSFRLLLNIYNCVAIFCMNLTHISNEERPKYVLLAAFYILLFTLIVVIYTLDQFSLTN